MARSDAQKEADKRYAEKIKGRHRQFSVNLLTEEYEELTEAIAASGMTKADFLRWAVQQLQGK